MILKVTPRKFGNVAAAAICEGVDVSRLVIRHALFSDKGKKAPAPAPFEIPGEEVVVDDDSIVLEKMFTSTGPEEEPADLPVSDFYKDIV